MKIVYWMGVALWRRRQMSLLIAVARSSFSLTHISDFRRRSCKICPQTRCRCSPVWRVTGRVGKALSYDVSCPFYFLRLDLVETNEGDVSMMLISLHVHLICLMIMNFLACAEYLEMRISFRAVESFLNRDKKVFRESVKRLLKPCQRAFSDVCCCQILPTVRCRFTPRGDTRSCRIAYYCVY